MSFPLLVHNGLPFDRAAVPSLPVTEFRERVLASVGRHGRVAALFGVGGGEAVELLAIVAHDHEGALELCRTRLETDDFPSMTVECPEVHLFEREIHEVWSVTPLGHPWLKPVRFQAASRHPGESKTVGVTNFYRVEGDEVHEVGVGPVHAGVIEPGHFRFQCHGERVFHLEISLGYQHRGVEKALHGGPDKRTAAIVETIAGDSTIAHMTAYASILEALAGGRVSARAHGIRAIALELERLANHTGTLGALAGDVGYLPTASHCGRLRGDFLNMTASICGSRFGRSLVRPGGVAWDIDGKRRDELLGQLARTERDVRQTVELLLGTASVLSRFEDAGRLPRALARELGLVGVAARASGLRRDVRHDHPWGIYRFAQTPVAVLDSGDVFARAFIRWLEIKRSISFVREQLASLPAGALRAPQGPLPPNTGCIALVEGTRGEVCHAALTDANGQFDTYKVIDPSFHNWAGLAVALRGEPISDFPLCNKSFDLSYCGHDL